MLSYCLDPLHNLVIHALLDLGETSITDLHHQITTTYQTPVSKAHLYNIINAMIAHNMVQKRKTQYQFHHAWIQAQAEMTTKLQRFAHQQQTEIYPGMSKVIRFSSFVETNKLWPYYASLLHHHTGALTRVKYAHHYSYLLSRIRQAPEQPNYYFRPDIVSYDACGSDTRLDRYTTHFLPPDSDYKAIPRREQFRGYSVYVIGEYLIEIHISDFLRTSLEHIYQTVSREEDFDHDFFASLFQIKSEGQFIIRHHPADAQFRTRDIMQYWDSKQK